MHCAMLCIGMRGDDQYVRHEATPVPEPADVRVAREDASKAFAAVVAITKPLLPLPAPTPAPAPRAVPVHVGLDESGELRIFPWRPRDPNNGKLYLTRRKFSEATARAMDPEAQPVGEPEIIRGYGQASTGDYLGEQTLHAPAGEMRSNAAAPSLPAWRDGSEHQWSRDPGRGRRYP